MVRQDLEVPETEIDQHLRNRATDFGIGDQAGRASDVDIALVELAEATARRPIRAPDRLDLVALVERREVLVVGDDAGQRHRQVIAQALGG